jgi:hypothetical protein
MMSCRDCWSGPSRIFLERRAILEAGDILDYALVKGAGRSSSTAGAGGCKHIRSSATGLPRIGPG